jgi:hypothetical protein
VSRLLLSLATMWVGLVTIVGAITLVFGSFFGFLSFLLGWLLAMAFGVLLSAPYFVNPPENANEIKLWIPGLQLPVIPYIFKTLSWTGWWVLRGIWWLIHRGWDKREAGATPSS